ncbi:MAG: hypothetical protein R2799_13320 [Crocinitomicaceae bacterium]
MRNKLATLFILGGLSFLFLSAEKETPLVSGSIKLEGTFIADREGKLSDLTIEIVNLHTNSLEDIQLNKTKARIDLPLGYKYMVYVKKPGYSTKKILVDAREAKRGDYKFEFEMELHKLEDEISTSNFRPVCILKYNRLKQKFVYDSDYTSIAKKDLQQEVYSKR